MSNRPSHQTRRMLLWCAPAPIVVAGGVLAIMTTGAVNPLAAIAAGAVLTSLLICGLILFAGGTRRVDDRGTDDPSNVRHADRELRESRERLDVLAHQLPGVIYVYDLMPNGLRKPVYVGPGFDQLFGPRSAEEIQKDITNLLDRLHPADRDGLRQRASRVCATGETLQIDLRFRNDAGEYRWCRSIGRAAPIKGGGERWYIVLIDSHAQHESEEQLRLLMEQTPGVLYKYEKHPDGSRRAVFIGPGFEELLGPQAASAIKEDINALFERVHPDDLERTITHAGKAADRGDSIGVTVRLRNDRGEYRWTESIGRPEPIVGGATRWSVILVDCHKQMELRRERERLADALEATTDFVSITGSGGNILFINRAGRRMIGINPGEQVADDRQLVELIPVKGRNSAEHVAWTGESTLKTRDGRSIPVSQVTLNHFDASGALEYTTTIARDLTDWKRVEAELRDTLERNRSIMACSPDFIMLVDLDGEIQFINRTVPGLTIESVLRTPIFQYVPESSHDAMRACFQRVVKSGVADRYETQYKTSDGVEHTFECHVGPVTRDDQVVSLIINARDVTEQRSVQKALAESEQQMRLITDALPVLISHIDEHGRYRFNNATYTSWFGAATEDLKGRSPADILSAEDYECIEPFIRRSLAGERTSFETLIHDAHGNDRYVDVTNVPRIDADGHVRGVYAIINDITASKKEAERRALMMRELDHRVKNNLAAVLSLAEQTVSASRTLEDFSASFLGRIHAMATTHELLAEAQWGGLDLERGAQLVLGPFIESDRKRIVMTGPAIMLPAQAALPLCLTLYEMATNAVKHGALSVAEGSVQLKWAAADGWIALHWLERNGPAIADDVDAGVGMELIRGFVEFELRGSLVTDLRADGLSCQIRVPIEPRSDDRSEQSNIQAPMTAPTAAD